MCSSVTRWPVLDLTWSTRHTQTDRSHHMDAPCHPWHWEWRLPPSRKSLLYIILLQHKQMFHAINECTIMIELLFLTTLKHSFSKCLKWFLVWDVIHTFCAYAMMPVHLSVTEVHWHIIANLGFKFRSHFTAHWPPCCLWANHLAPC